MHVCRIAESIYLFFSLGLRLGSLFGHSRVMIINNYTSRVSHSRAAEPDAVVYKFRTPPLV